MISIEFGEFNSILASLLQQYPRYQPSPARRTRRGLNAAGARTRFPRSGWVRGIEKSRRGEFVVQGNIYVDMLPHRPVRFTLRLTLDTGRGGPPSMGNTRWVLQRLDVRP